MVELQTETVRHLTGHWDPSLESERTTPRRRSGADQPVTAGSDSNGRGPMHAVTPLRRHVRAGRRRYETRRTCRADFGSDGQRPADALDRCFVVKDHAYPGYRIIPLPGQEHMAQLTAPELVAESLIRFIVSPDQP